MWEIELKFDDYTRHKNHGSIVLNPNKTIHLHFTDYPVSWSGLINGEKVLIVLKNSSSSLIENYDWPAYPEKFDNLKSEIVSAIDNYVDEKMS